jgi:Amt family ammonium transporter
MRASVLALAGGKAIGVALLLGGILLWRGSAAHAQTAAEPTAAINAINTMWVLLAAFLVFCMQVGFVMLEAGFARSLVQPAVPPRRRLATRGTRGNAMATRACE